MTDQQFKVLVVLVSLWGAVLEGTLLSIRVALDQPKVQTIEFEVLPQALPMGASQFAATGSAIPPPMVTWLDQSISSVRYR
jgi:hypothetical protein